MSVLKKDKEPLPLEIERKFLVRLPELDVIKKCACYTDSFIEQTYIESHREGVFGRVRRRECAGNVIYYHTTKEDITAVTRVEIEKEIDKAEYEELLELRKKDCKTIKKERITFEYSGQLFELDIFPFWNDRALLEIELKDEEQKVFFPDFISIIKEVTRDKRYRNSALSKQVFTEPI